MGLGLARHVHAWPTSLLGTMVPSRPSEVETECLGPSSWRWKAPLLWCYVHAERSRASCLVRTPGLEPGACRLGGGRSVLLSYVRLVSAGGVEPNHSIGYEPSARPPCCTGYSMPHGTRPARSFFSSSAPGAPRGLPLDLPAHAAPLALICLRVSRDDDPDSTWVTAVPPATILELYCLSVAIRAERWSPVSGLPS